MMKTQIVDVPELDWNFRSHIPCVNGARHEQVDPFPCYAHDSDAIRVMLTHLESCVDLEVAPHALYVLHHETVARTNGWANDQTTWDEDRERWNIAPGTITLPGKRIPPHPAMTRYVVAHEYGHHVEYEMCRIADVDTGGLDDEYARLRALPDGWDQYGGGQWHQNVGEVMANDFRILVANVETEFWPHPQVCRPHDTGDAVLRDWWVDHLQDSLLKFVQSSS